MTFLLIRVLCIIIGYLFGLCQTGYWYGRMHHVDIQKEGSGNAGTTNALRVMGWKAGVLTFLGDVCKCILAVLLVRLLFRESCGDFLPALSMYTGVGCVLGHNYPFYLHFKGGKGIAVTAGLLLIIGNTWMVFLCLAVFLLLVAGTRYVSLGSLAGVFVFAITIVVNGQMGGFGMAQSYLYEMYVLAALLVVSAFYMHRENIQRLIHGTENKLSVGKKK